MTEEPQRATFSISVRLQRTVVQEGYVSVLVTHDLIRDEPDADGKYQMDTAKMIARAVELGGELAEWQDESTDIVLHPIQRSRPMRDDEQVVPHDDVPPLFTAEP
jgi:hypothetical protein